MNGYIDLILPKNEQMSLFGENPVMEKMRKEALKSKRKRFKNPTYLKYYKEDKKVTGETQDLVLWGKMNQIYIQLANYFPFPTQFEDRYKFVQDDGEDTLFVDDGIIRTYKISYTKEEYMHKGDDGIIKKYKGEEFFSNYAEIIDSEDFGINERLFLHFELFNYLESGYSIEQLTDWINMLLNLMLEGFTAELLIIFLINMRCCDA